MGQQACRDGGGALLTAEQSELRTKLAGPGLVQAGRQASWASWVARLCSRSNRLLRARFVARPASEALAAGVASFLQDWISRHARRSSGSLQ
jgi:hypothetical protein